jgi:hypothetical protein
VQWLAGSPGSKQSYRVFDGLRKVQTSLVLNKAVLPLRRRDCDSIKKKVDYAKFMVSRHRIVVALVGEAPLRTEGSISRRL